jgi:hypothetical protein
MSNKMVSFKVTICLPPWLVLIEPVTKQFYRYTWENQPGVERYKPSVANL